MQHLKSVRAGGWPARTGYRLRSSDGSSQHSTTIITEPQPMSRDDPPSGDLCLLLAKARRLYDRAMRLGDLASAAKHQRIYKGLFERRRAILLAQARGRV